MNLHSKEIFRTFRLKDRSVGLVFQPRITPPAKKIGEKILQSITETFSPSKKERNWFLLENIQAIYSRIVGKVRSEAYSNHIETMVDELVRVRDLVLDNNRRLKETILQFPEIYQFEKSLEDNSSHLTPDGFLEKLSGKYDFLLRKVSGIIAFCQGFCASSFKLEFTLKEFLLNLELNQSNNVSNSFDQLNRQIQTLNEIQDTVENMDMK
ncbi:MAG: hypothetical protein HQM09_22180 [Candidatus Riflebacteria bacterium]|nr:hypothetical protein [Candidatus Riflebacteria bacterium]